MRGTGGDTDFPSQQVPKDCTEECGDDNFFINESWRADNIAADSFRDAG